jgi:hypothetical protein
MPVVGRPAALEKGNVEPNGPGQFRISIDTVPDEDAPPTSVMV